MKLYLRALSKNEGKQIFDMLQEIAPNDNGFRNEMHGVSYQEFTVWLERNEGFSKGIGLEDWMVPQTTYWLFHNQTPVGYGNELLRLLLNECSKMWIKPVQIGVNISNIRSNRVVQHNGGVLVKGTENKNIYHITH